MRSAFFLPILLCMFSITYASDLQLFRVGIGGFYGDYASGINGNSFKNAGGYVNIIARGFNETQNFIVEGGGDIGFGKGSNQTNVSGNMSMYEGFLNVGYNIATQTYPLYLKLEYAYGRIREKMNDSSLLTDLHQIGGILHGFVNTQQITYEYALGYYYVPHAYHYNREKMNDSSLLTDLHQIGGILHGFVNTQQITYEYALGYYYVPHAYHYNRTQDSEIRLGVDGYTYALKAQVGFAYKISPKISYFMNLKAKYYDLAKSHLNSTFTYPKAQNLVGMLELGLQF